MTETMTLAFDVEALDPLADPAAAFEDARQWSSYVGVVSDRMAYQVVNYLREMGVYNEDFFSRADRARSLEHVKGQTDTDRYVFVGPTEEDAELAQETGWEFLTVKEAAEKADWTLAVQSIEQ